MRNSKDWVLELRDGRHIAISLSPYRYLESLLHYSISEGEAVIGTNFFILMGKLLVELISVMVQWILLMLIWA